MLIFSHKRPQILTQEDWNGVLYNGMAATSPLAALYFVALMTFGNYVLFNLLVAILVEGFQAEVSRLVQMTVNTIQNVFFHPPKAAFQTPPEARSDVQKVISVFPSLFGQLTIHLSELLRD